MTKKLYKYLTLALFLSLPNIFLACHTTSCEFKTNKKQIDSTLLNDKDLVLSPIVLIPNSDWFISGAEYDPKYVETILQASLKAFEENNFTVLNNNELNYDIKEANIEQYINSSFFASFEERYLNKNILIIKVENWEVGLFTQPSVLELKLFLYNTHKDFIFPEYTAECKFSEKLNTKLNARYWYNVLYKVFDEFSKRISTI